MRGKLIVGVGLAALSATAGASELMIDSEAIGGLEARAIGPAVMGGRIAAIDAVPEDPLTIYVGAAAGGVWKSSDGGVSFKPIFDEHTQSIGAIAVDAVRPKTVWVGTGESWTRNSVSVGTGVYRTTDGGDTWQFTGLGDSERIARIAVDPTSPDTVYVCATGHLWNANEERGVYRTRDGGKSWERVLFVDADTGCSDLALDPEDPRVLYAGMWQFRRRPWSFHSGGPGSGLYKTTDGGDAWRELEQGLPAGEKGRVSVAVAPSRPRVVYAVVEADKTWLYRSDDLGEHWTRLNNSFNVQARPFYFGHLVVDPTDPDRVYKPGFSLAMSSDGGRTTADIGGGYHGDLHALWINPKNPHEMVLGTDGGVYVSHDRGAHWRYAQALPVSQFYEVGYDMDWPYNVYGGLQDNGTWTGPSRSVGGIQNQDWRNLGFGDGFHAQPDPADSGLVYLEYQGGNVQRVRRATGETKEIKPYEGKGDPKFRFNWNTPIHLSPSAPGTLYVGAQFLFRSRNRGDTWERISPDLTTNEPAKQRQEESGGLTIDNSTAENHCTIYTISESPLDPTVVWVGTDDGNLQVTRDGGKSWKNVAPAVPALPAHTWVSHVEASRHQAGVAYATFDGHASGDMKTYLYRTADFGESWQPLAGEGVEGFAHVVREDLENPNLLFLGTEMGLYLSADGGRHWARFGGNLPRAPVRDLAVHPREHDLIIATHGRGIYIVDDLTPLRRLSPEVLAADFAVLPSRPAVMTIPAALQEFPGDDEFVGANPPEAASVVYYQKKRHLFGDLRLEIYGARGELISTVAGGKRRGLNRVYWPMRLKPPKMPAATSLVYQPFSFVGPRVPEGTYRVKIVRGKEAYETEVALVADPRSRHTAEDRRVQQETALRLYGLLERLTYVADAVTDLRDQARARADALGRDRLAKEAGAFAEALEGLRKELAATSEAGLLSGQERLREKLGFLYGAVNGYEGRPTDSQLERVGVLEGDLEAAERRFASFSEDEAARLNASLERRGQAPLRAMAREEWAAKQEGPPGGGAPSAALGDVEGLRALFGTAAAAWRRF